MQDIDRLKEIDRLKVEERYFQAGALACATGHDDNYGCHFGMRATYEWAKSQYHDGWKEANYYLCQAAERELRKMERTRTTFLVSADHVIAEYGCTDLPIVVTDDGEYGFYANAPGYGMSKNYRTAEGAIRAMLTDHACTNIRIVKA